MPRPDRFNLVKETRYPLYRELGELQGAWKCKEILTPTGVRSPELPARGESLYRLSYRGQLFSCKFRLISSCLRRNEQKKREICDGRDNWQIGVSWSVVVLTSYWAWIRYALQITADSKRSAMYVKLLRYVHLAQLIHLSKLHKIIKPQEVCYN